MLLSRSSELYLQLQEMSERIARLEVQMEELKNDVEEIKDDVKMLQKYVMSNGRKYTLYVLAMVLSFIAAILGLHWVPPGH